MRKRSPHSRGHSGQEPLILRLLGDIDRFTPERIEALWQTPTNGDSSLEDLIIRSGLADERDIATAYANHYLMPLFDPPADEPPPVDPAVAAILPGRLCRDHLMAPLSDDGSTLEVAVFDPDSLRLADEIRSLTGRQMRPLFTPRSVIEVLIRTLYERDPRADAASTDVTAPLEEIDKLGEAKRAGDTKGTGAREAAEVVRSDQAPPPGRDGRVVRYVNSLFEQALRTGASDVHIEPYEDHCRVRLRVDGTLAEIAPPPTPLLDGVIGHLKTLSEMDVDERRLPQDGVIHWRSDDRRVDMRVSTCPTVFGEKVVMRVPDKIALPPTLATLGLEERQFRDLSEAIRSPHGLMLVTGPTGSGKSTTLYSCLNALNKPDTNICTVEDTVEFKFGGMNQVQTRPKIGLDFATAVRGFLKQDPDVIMVGEIREGETADICLQAASAGNFVCSTLPTGDPLSGVTRLKAMGVETFSLSRTLRLLVAQRLLRRLCPHCREPVELDESTATRLGLPAGRVVYRPGGYRPGGYRPGGCRECRGVGYKGRFAVYEIIRVNARLAEMIQREVSVDTMKKAAQADGIKSLAQIASEKVAAGWTSSEEALAVTGGPFAGRL